MHRLATRVYTDIAVCPKKALIVPHFLARPNQNFWALGVAPPFTTVLLPVKCWPD